MRYRRLGYRYAVILTAAQPRPFGEAWRHERLGVSLAQPAWRPPADVYETHSTIAIRVELAGVEQDELDVLLFEDAVVVEGTRRLPTEAPGVYHAAQIRQGPFRLELPLPVPIDPEQVQARYERGLLEMTFSKKER